MKLNRLTTGLLVGLTIVSTSVIAAGDPEAGKTKALACKGCHGIPGYANVYPTYQVPKVAGQHAEYIVAALKAYKSGQRQHKTMQSQAATLSEQDMADIAAFFAGTEQK